MEELKYPIGRFKFDGEATREKIEGWIGEIETLPRRLRKAVEGLSEEQFDTPYRPGGWSVRQVVHHLGDSHLNSYIRFKWTLTEERPRIKPYYEDRWAELPDSLAANVEESLAFLEILHKRWVKLLRSLTDADWRREFDHPESGVNSLAKTLALYAWHGNHHLAHVTGLRERMGW